ncbi:MAG TPA: DUF4249 domain-containing protein [Puia sp.]|nr:DUF4249 domain-containing protein [Puia sp.]
MKNKVSETYKFIFFLLIMISCKQSYTPPALNANKNYLVVDGFLNAGNDSTVITLTRTRNLNTGDAQIIEGNAQLFVEGDAGYSLQLTNFGNGKYGSPNLNLLNNQNYRLKILTSNGSSYISDFTPVKSTPSIDSIVWSRSDSGVSIFLNTHDPSNNTRYYKWDFVETWEFHSFYETFLHYNPVDSSAYLSTVSIPHICWQTSKSTNIIIASSAKLSADIINLMPIETVPLNSPQIAVKYSISIRQFGLTKEAFNYWGNLQKSTEQTGTIFDAQPSQITGNIHCITNPNEPVLGFISAGKPTEKRIFVSNSEVLPWEYDQPCGEEFHRVDSLTYYIHKSNLPIKEIATNGIIQGYNFSNNFCVDCTIRNGTNIKPSFWQ